MIDPDRTRTAAAAETDAATAVFLRHRELLFSVVYNMLGSIADTEDVLQETWLSWAPRGSVPIENPRAYLVRVAVNHALGRRTAMNRRRETYVGQWLPEPVVHEPAGAENAVIDAESFSMALLVVLESLTPIERAVFVLNEVFAYSHSEIAELVDRSPTAVRQLAYRARQHVQARRPRQQADARLRRAVTERFVAAAMGGDLAELLAVLAPEVTLWTDGGSRGPATSLRPVHGCAAVAELFLNVARGLRADYQISYRAVSGDPCAVVFDGSGPLAVVVLDVLPDNTIGGIYSVTNPDKLTHIR
ncbi:RNA polymerase sigma factor SigJ [Nocardia sp. XZ_19_369]|uniref:RNA polymerase sigma factor SigJ n=1 Tax=Nocardia sp. XZ_19_369 TaxID=2769487 RepID=UPI00188FC626|nr:RNA polymerase sigma factor SigJ [Nocardia sp. XZ_19_369]